MDRRVSNAIAIVVTVVWAASFLADAFIESYDPPPSVHTIMMLVGGAAFADGIFRNRNGNGRNGGNGNGRP